MKSKCCQAWIADRKLSVIILLRIWLKWQMQLPSLSNKEAEGKFLRLLYTMDNKDSVGLFSPHFMYLWGCCTVLGISLGSGWTVCGRIYIAVMWNELYHHYLNWCMQLCKLPPFSSWVASRVWRGIKISSNGVICGAGFTLEHDYALLHEYYCNF